MPIAIASRIISRNAALRKDAGGQARFWLRLAIALALLSCLPVLVARYPQMTDYPAHLARYHVMLDGGRSPWLARYYGFEWKWTGNLGVDILIRPFAGVFGLEQGGRIIVGLIPPLTGLGIIAVEWVLRRRVTFGSFLAMALIWSPMLVLGLVNFALGQTVALWAFAGWVALEGRRWRALAFMPVGLVVWLCHLSAWGMLGVMVFGYEWSRDKSWRAFLAPWPLLAPLLPMLLIHGNTGDFSYGANWRLYKYAIWLRAMRDTNQTLDMDSLFFVGLSILFAMALFRLDGRLGWAGAALLVGSLVAPRHISGGDYVDYRLITSGLLVSSMAIDWRSPLLQVAGGALFMTRLWVTTCAWQANSAQMAQDLAALDHVPQGARVASAVLTPTERWPLNSFEHVGAYAVVRRDAWSNANFAVAHIHMLHMREGTYSDPSQRIIRSIRLPLELTDFGPTKQADYLWYVGAKEPASLPAGAKVIWRGNHSLLARLAKSPEPD